MVNHSHYSDYNVLHYESNNYAESTLWIVTVINAKLSQISPWWMNYYQLWTQGIIVNDCVWTTVFFTQCWPSDNRSAPLTSSVVGLDGSTAHTIVPDSIAGVLHALLCHHLDTQTWIWLPFACVDISSLDMIIWFLVSDVCSSPHPHNHDFAQLDLSRRVHHVISGYVEGSTYITNQVNRHCCCLYLSVIVGYHHSEPTN